jgi:DUF4097 and DUF4098 domain-containing protein YvlB
MKKRTMIALIVAAALIITGGIILVLGLSFAGGSKGESKLVRQEITIQESFDNIAIDTADCDVKFAMFSGRDDCMVEVRSYKNVKHTATVEDGTLKIKMIDKRNWTDHINIGWTESMEMTVYLPAAEYESLQVRTTTGDIMILEEPSFKEMLLRTSTGDISCAGVSGDVLDCMTTTGDVSVQNSVADVLKLQSNTGDFAVSVVTGNEIHMRTNTGEVNAENVNALMFTCQTESGDVELEGVLAEDYLQLFADTGDIHITNSDAATVNIETNTGDVSGNFLTPKWFSAFSDTGDVTVPNTPEGGECRIQTDSGDIHFE